MGLLPAARTVTLGPDDPVPSALLNELQDVLIADHATKTHVISASAASAQQSGADTGATPNGGNWNFIQLNTTIATALYVYYPVTLPAGSTIRSWALGGTKNTNNTHTMTAELLEVSLSGGSASIVGVSQTQTAAGAVALGQSGLAKVLLTSQQYVIRAKSPDSSTANGVDQTGAITVTADPPV